MDKLEQSIKSKVPTISSEVETLRKLLNEIEALSEILESELLHESLDILPVTPEEGHSLDSLSEQINYMNQIAFRVASILQNISKGLGSFSKGRSIE